MGRPSQDPACTGIVGHQDGGVAYPARSDFHRDRSPGDRFHHSDHFANRTSHAGPQINDGTIPATGEIVERLDMRLRKVCHMHIVPDACAVGSRVVFAEHAQRRTAEGRQNRQGDEMRLGVVALAKLALGVGAGAPPVPSEDGLILLYHERDGDEHYTVKAALLDDETGLVKSMLPDPIMRPELEWERAGDVNNVVFIQGAVPQPDGTIYVTYGAADRCVGAATIATDELLAALRAAA